MWMFIAITVSLIDFTILSDLPEGSFCQLHTGETGICKDSLQCQWLLENLDAKKMTHADIRRCSFKGLLGEIICCKDDKLDPSTRIPTNSPCDLGLLFDNKTCTLPVNDPTATPLTKPDLIDRTKSCGGCKAETACRRYLNNQFYPPKMFEQHFVINGIPASRNDAPHMVALGYPNKRKGYSFECAGSLIAHKWIVTAAHCITDKRKPVIVRMGKLNLHEDVDGFMTIDRTITQIIRHPNYSNLKKKNDIALIEFDGHVDYHVDLRPACIRTDVNDVPVDTEMLISGWGSVAHDRLNRSKVLLKATVFTVPLDTCNQTLVGFNQLSDQPSLRGLTQSQICALNTETGSDACQGDSGGPLFTKQPSGWKYATLHGVVSFGVSCGTALPGVYTRIASFIDWIESIVWP